MTQNWYQYFISHAFYSFSRKILNVQQQPKDAINHRGHALAGTVMSSKAPNWSWMPQFGIFYRQNAKNAKDLQRKMGHPFGDGFFFL